MWYTLSIAVLFLAIVASLGTGLYFLLTNPLRSHKLVYALTVRISLTVLLMLVIIVAWLQGGVGHYVPWLYP